MKEIVEFTARLVEASARAYERKWSFLSVCAAIFVGSALILASFGLLPESSPAQAEPEVVLSAAPTPIALPENPVKIIAPAINLSAIVENPTTTDIKILDTYLLKGAVRYPTSALLGEAGNVVIFGHSSYLPVVGNQAYKAMNGIQKLVAGDVITVYSLNMAYTYRVKSVSKESATEGGIPLSIEGRVLTLATCDSFGAKTDRFVVVADFVESHPISSQD